MSKIFLSHSSRDNFEALALAQWLAENGWSEVFLDLDPERGIAAGERWERALHAAAQRCEAVIFLVSQNWLASRWCGREFSLARGLNKKLFGVIIEPGLGVDALPGEFAGTWQATDLCAGADARVFRVALPGSHEEKHVAFSQAGLRRLKNGLDKAGLDPKFFAWPPEDEAKRAPYRGLRALEEADAGVFFGREAPILVAADKLRGLYEAAAPRLLVILGASGAGKSSFLRAGLLPRLKRDDAHFLCLAPIRPERAALTGETGLLGALEKAFPDRAKAQLREAIDAGAPALRKLLAELARGAFARTLAAEDARKAPAIVLAIDQAEELFRADGAEESAALLALVRDLAARDDPAVIVVFAIRSDGYDRLEQAPALEGFAQTALPLLPMPRGNYQGVIEGPAARAEQAGQKLAVEPELTQRLLEEIEKGGGGDALPLLAFALEQLYVEYGATGALRLADFEKLGGLEGAIGKAIERAFTRADSDRRIPQDHATREALLRRGLIPWLAGVDPDTRGPRRSIALKTDIPEEARPLIELLVEERLLVADTTMRDGARVETFEPAHEALLRQWGLLRGWLADDLGRLATLEGVRRAARDWEANAKAEGWLAHQGGRLAEARALDVRPDLAAQLDARDRAYLEGCGAREAAAAAEREKARASELARANAEAERARAGARFARNLTLVASLAALLLAGVGWWAWTQRNAAIEQRLNAEAATKEAVAQKATADAATADAVKQKANAETATADAVKQKAAAETAAEEAKAQTAKAEAAKADAVTQKAAAEAAADDARAQRDRAEKAVAKAIDAANTVVFSMAQKLRNVSGMQVSLLQAILDPALKLQDDLIASGEVSLNLRLSQALALNEAANTRRALNDTEDALTDAQRARDIMLDLIRQQPDDTKLQRDLGDIYQSVGEALKTQGRLSEALQSFSSSLAVREQLAKSDPADESLQANLALSYLSIGGIQVTQGALALAMQSYSTSLAIIGDLLKSQPDNLVWQENLATINVEIGAVEVKQRDLPLALKSYLTSLAIWEHLTNFDPKNTNLQYGLWSVHMSIGELQLRQDDFFSALKYFSRGLTIIEALAKSDPQNAVWQANLAACFEAMGLVQTNQGNLAPAEQSYTASLSIFERLVAADPSNTAFQRNLSVAYQRVGELQIKQGHFAEATKSYSAEQSITERLTKSDPANTEWKFDLAALYERLGEIQSAEHLLSDAVKSYSSCVAIFQELIKTDSTNNGWRHDLAGAYYRMGQVELNQNALTVALESFSAGVSIRERLAKSDPNNMTWQLELATAYLDIGDLQATHDAPARALRSYSAALAIREGLSKSDPNNVDRQRDLAFATERIAHVQDTQGLISEALQSSSAALAIRQQISKSTPDDSNLKRELAQSYDGLGHVQFDEGDLTGTSLSYSASLAILEGLTKSNSENSVWQHDLAWHHLLSFQMYLKQGDRTRAREELAAGRAILVDIVAKHPEQVDWKEQLTAFEAILKQFGD